MRFAFDDQQVALRAAVRAVLERYCTTADLRAVAERADSGDDAGRAAERWTVLSELGAPGLMVPADHGGLGLSEVEMVGVCEEAGRAALPGPLVESAALAVPLLVRAASLGGARSPAAGVAADTLGQLAQGELVAAVGGVEPAAEGTVVTSRGPLPGGGVSTARVAGARRAGLFLLVFDDPSSGRQLHAVPAHALRVSATASIDPVRDLGRVTWSPEPATLIADGPAAASLVEELADRGAAAAAAQLLGLAETMITLTVDYAGERRQFGRPIGTFQAVAHQLADARVRLEFARPATYRAADSLARGVPDRSQHASVAKALASDAADLAARVALQVHGAIGYTWECDLHLFMKRAWALSASWGDAATHRARVLAAALDRGGRLIA